MSKEVAILAIIQPAEGKLDRMKQLLVEATESMKTNEPGTLEFSIYEERTERGVSLSLFERYESWAAVEAHESSDNYTAFFKTMMDEELLAGPPTISKAEFFHGFKR